MHVEAEQRLHQVLREEREDADQRALEDHIGHRDDQTTGHADNAAETVGDVAVERAGRREVFGHRGVADGEQRQHDGGDQVARGSERTISEAHGDGDVADHCGDRGGSGDRHEHHADDADRVRFQSVDFALVLVFVAVQDLVGHYGQPPGGRRAVECGVRHYANPRSLALPNGSRKRNAQPLT